MLRVYGLEFRVQGSGFGVKGSGFRVEGLGFRVSGFGFITNVVQKKDVVRNRQSRRHRCQIIIDHAHLLREIERGQALLPAVTDACT